MLADVVVAKLRDLRSPRRSSPKRLPSESRRPDPYAVLGISRDATPDEILKAYRRKVLRWHPDRPQGNAAKFIEVREAYQSLSKEGPDAGTY